LTGAAASLLLQQLLFSLLLLLLLLQRRENPTQGLRTAHQSGFPVLACLGVPSRKEERRERE
jgi:hypothetical protein